MDCDVNSLLICEPSYLFHLLLIYKARDVKSRWSFLICSRRVWILSWTHRFQLFDHDLVFMHVFQSTDPLRWMSIMKDDANGENTMVTPIPFYSEMNSRFKPASRIQGLHTVESWIEKELFSNSSFELERKPQ